MYNSKTVVRIKSNQPNQYCSYPVTKGKQRLWGIYNCHYNLLAYGEDPSAINCNQNLINICEIIVMTIILTIIVMSIIHIVYKGKGTRK